jgi:hypothetical protein
VRLDRPAEVGHVQPSLAPLFSPQLAGLQSAATGDGHYKLPAREFDSRSYLLGAEFWFQNQREEPVVTALDEFVKREYISLSRGPADKTKSRFSAFVGIISGNRRALCLIPHDVIVDGVSVPCREEWASEKDALAHVSEHFGYAAYKCQITDPQHRW